MSILDDNSSDQEENREVQPAPSAADQLLAEIKNEQGEQKYKTVEDALKGLQNAQSHIPTLEKELREMREKVATKEDLKELLKSAKPSDDEVVITPQEAKQLTPEEILAIVEGNEKKKVAESNILEVKKIFEEQFGAEYKKELDARGASAGLTPELAKQLASTSPDAFLKLLGVEKPKAKPPVGGKGLNTETLDGKKPAPKRFDPTRPSENSQLSKWNESVERTLADLQG